MDSKDTQSEELEINEELYRRLAKMRNQGRSKENLIKLLIEEKHESDDATSIAQKIDEDFREYKYDQAMEYRKYGIITLVAGLIIFFGEMFLLGKVHLITIPIVLVLMGYFYSKYASIKRMLGFF